MASTWTEVASSSVAETLTPAAVIFSPAVT